MSKLDLTKPVQCRNGDKVRILCTDRKGEYPVVGLRTDSDGDEIVYSWKLDGEYSMKYVAPDFDLINVPEKKTAYVVIPPSGISDCCIFDKLPRMDHWQEETSIIRIEYTVGQKDL